MLFFLILALTKGLSFLFFSHNNFLWQNIFFGVHPKIVYCLTEKPEYYVHIERLRTLQEHRQVEYNNWCKRNGVYNGSYFPKDPDTLTRNGWVESTSPKNKTNDKRIFYRKSSRQTVRYDKKINGTDIEYEHYHWFNKTGKPAYQRDLGKDKWYLDRYGNECRKKSREPHLAPLDKLYKYRK